MQNKRKDPAFKANKIVNERAYIQNKRQEPASKAKELVYQRVSKQNARKQPFILECERIKKQQHRQQKRKLEEMSAYDNSNKICNRVVTSSHSHKSYKSFDQIGFKSIEVCIKQFHSNISVGPLFVCTCCHQTWFRKSVSVLKNTYIPVQSKRLYCTKFASVNNEEWVCHSCLTALRNSKVPKLSVVNGMKWPEKPREFDLHQLEERLIALRIPFMQIGELPRGGQYSLKGNVINVPVDIQPTVNCLPRPMYENFTVSVQLKKKLSYKKVDFKEHVRPLRV